MADAAPKESIYLSLRYPPALSQTKPPRLASPRPVSSDPISSPISSFFHRPLPRLPTPHATAPRRAPPPACLSFARTPPLLRHVRTLLPDTTHRPIRPVPPPQAEQRGNKRQKEGGEKKEKEKKKSAATPQPRIPRASRALCPLPAQVRDPPGPDRREPASSRLAPPPPDVPVSKVYLSPTYLPTYLSTSPVQVDRYVLTYAPTGVREGCPIEMCAPSRPPPSI
ncbi:hypothetical protein GGS23DRAFT_105252 [Durotheca rogersii]|uniref:uncharacterized protein n=1 Tax=Durotheca rogersii TaxID=419775 RepID=UPI00221F6D93|nr:uncharacterized protein GGS23DRAFT_105252 [Durotheca rogersii]KAI5862103.1 hypothetical protein GGS23DRAFT_105252 [Durotheca rogersii]